MVKVDPKTKRVLFTFQPPTKVKKVSVAGEFNLWDPTATPMKKDPKGLWKASLKLDPGEYQFRYVTDGLNWYCDDSAAKVPNGFGAENSLLKIE
jgi:1,4-alpha-glucan branching enzyme